MAEMRSTVEIIDMDKFKNNEEALELRKIFNLIEGKKLNKAKEISKFNILYEKSDDKENLNFKILHDFNIRPRNRYKLKLQKIFNRKNLSN